MGWGILGDIAGGAKDLAGDAADFVGDAADGAGKAFDSAMDAAGGAARSVGNTVSNASISDIGHTALDVAGMVPVIGEVADLANAGWYLAEGDKTNAALSAAGAIPFAGNAATAAKWAKKGVNAVDMVADGAKAVDKAGDAVRLAESAGDTAKAVDAASTVAKADTSSGPQVLFGQKRVGPTFSGKRPDGSGPPVHLAGRQISDVANDLKTGKIHPDDVPVDAFHYGDNLVSTNTRSLAALSEAGMTPTKVNVVEPTTRHLDRLDETPIISNAPLPGNRVPVTPTIKNLTVLRVIETPGGIR